MTNLKRIARGLDAVWWVLIFALVYDAYRTPASRVTLFIVLFRWIIRGLYDVEVKLRYDSHTD